MNTLGTVCLLNDSFPPLIDGVSNTVLNYAAQIQYTGQLPLIITPANPGANDQQFTYPVVRYPSIATQKFEGYPAGIPFSPKVARNVKDRNISLLHTHCPVMSTFMARQLRQITNAPVVFTYHTKFDIDIEHIVKSEPLQLAAKKVLVSNISACDEVWTVSHGAGENLRSLGYAGDYIVMPNGVDMPCKKATKEQIHMATNGYDLPENAPVYLFVGRMMWYKGLRIIIDALARLKAMNQDFRMVFIGDGDDKKQVETYASECDIQNQCIFTGAIRDREQLRGWYSRADLFLFPSSYDTNGLVVREAAACSLASVLIRGSCASEGVTDSKNGFLIEENAESMAHCLSGMTKDKMLAVGNAASQDLYISWETAVKDALDRYQIVIDKQRSGEYPPHRKPTEGVMKINGKLMETLAQLSSLRRSQ